LAAVDEIKEEAIRPIKDQLDKASAEVDAEFKAEYGDRGEPTSTNAHIERKEYGPGTVR
jgi:hypothetical protein